MAKLTLIGMYNFDNTLFDLLNVPEGIDRQTLIDDIMLRGGEFEVLYPDMDFLKYSIGAWSRKYQSTFIRWTNVLKKEYNPIENYDRMESWTDSGTSSENTTGSRSGSASGNTSGNTSSTNTDLVSAYDAGDDLTTKGQSLTSGTDSSNSTSSTSENTTGSASGTTSGTHEGRVHGNIGVMSAQNMVNQELDLGYRNIYNMMTDLFLTEFVLPVY